MQGQQSRKPDTGPDRKTTDSRRLKSMKRNMRTKKIIAVILLVCMALTGTMTGASQALLPDGNPTDLEASAASCPALKKITYTATGNQREDIIGFAKTQLGYAEGSGNNTYFGKWYGCNYNPWCAMFVVWSARKAGVTKDVIPSQANADRSWAKRQGVYYKSKQWGGSYKPKKGDLIYFSWSVRDWADHIGMVTGTGKQGGTTYVYTIEGNKHDKVVEGSYAINNRYILGYASPKYLKNGKVEEPTEEPEETTETTTETGSEPPTGTGEAYTLKYRDGLDATGSDEEDAIIPPVKGFFGGDLMMSDKRFKRTGYTYSNWKVYRESSGTLVYLCKDTATGQTEKWFRSSAIPADYTQVKVPLGTALKINDQVSGTIYASPVWKKKKFKVTYDANGGTGAPEVQKKTYGKTLTLTTSVPSRTGYTFQGWSSSSTASSADYQPGGTYSADEAATLYAVWKFKAYKAEATAGVKTRSGPGTSYDKSSSVKSGSTIKIVDVSGSWGKLEDGSWISLKYTMRLGAKSYTLEYTDNVETTANDTMVIAPVTVKYGKSVSVENADFSRTGYKYSKWQVYRLINGDKHYLCLNQSNEEGWYKLSKVPNGWKQFTLKPGENLTIRKSVGDRIFIAPVWTPEVYKISYDANGGKSAPKAQKKEYGKALKLSKDKPSRKLHEFLGWAAASDADEAQYKAGGTFKENQDTTLYAVWKSTVFKVRTTAKTEKHKGPGKDYEVTGTLAKGKIVTIVRKEDGWGKLKNGGWIRLKDTKKADDSRKSASKPSTENDSDTQKDSDEGTAPKNPVNDMAKGPTFTVRILADDGVNARSGPGVDYAVDTIFQKDLELTIIKVKNGWGQVEGSGTWILLKYTRITKGYKIRIDSDDLNQRSGPGSNYESKGYIEPGTYDITMINGAWGKVKATGYWVYLAYTKRVN